MSSQLSAVPIDRRRRAAWLISAVGVVLVAVGVLPWALDSPGVVRAMSVVALLAAALMGLMAWGTAHSVRLDTRRADEAALDAAVSAAAAEAGVGCSCGHQHDPEEMAVVDEESAGCGGGCATCVHPPMASAE